MFGTSHWRLSLMLIALSTFALWSAGCAESESAAGQQTKCAAFNDCADGFYCRLGTCQRDCDAQTPCEQGKQCNARGRCEAVAGSCQSAAECTQVPTESPYCMGAVSIEPGRTPVCTASATCRYEDRQVNCSEGCDPSSGLCNQSSNTLCANIMCNEPPAPSCKDDKTLVTYDTTGRCMQGTCDYAKNERTCDAGCEAGSCKSALCLATKCDSATAPTPSCSTTKATVAITYPNAPVCVVDDQGMESCNFEPAFDDCAYYGATCEAGQCKGAVPQTGELVITEYLVRPDDAFTSRFNGQWIELHNTTQAAIDLNGWTLQYTYLNSVKEHTIENQDDLGVPVPLLVEPGATLLLSNSPDALDGGEVRAAYEWRQIVLENQGSLKVLKPSGDVSDFLYWEPGSTMRYHARQIGSGVALTADSNDKIKSWCPNMASTYGVSKKQFGTPGTPNTTCLDDPCQSFGCTNKPDEYCRNESEAVDFMLTGATCQVSKFQAPYCDFMAFSTACDLSQNVCAQGACVPLPPNLPAEGEVIFTEFMGNPDGSDALGEWLEVYNTTDKELALFSLKIQDNEEGGSFTSWLIDTPGAVVPPKGYAVFGPNTDPLTNGGIPNMYNLSSKMLKNTPKDDPVSGLSAMKLKLTTISGGVIDEAYYAKQRSGVSQQLNASLLDQGAVANDEATNYCAPSNEYSAQFGRGTPGAANEVCN